MRFTVRLQFKADIPGQSKDKIQVTVDGHRLHITVVCARGQCAHQGQSVALGASCLAFSAAFGWQAPPCALQLLLCTV
jgi:hypothetical protein